MVVMAENGKGKRGDAKGRERVATGTSRQARTRPGREVKYIVTIHNIIISGTHGRPQTRITAENQ